MLNMQNVKDIEIQEGDVRTIHDKDSRLIWGRLAYDTKYAGDTTQNGEPTPDVPVAINVVTGEQTVTISDGVSSQSYEINLTGKNLLDMSLTESGGIDTSGGNITNTASWRTAGYIKVSPNTSYTFSLSNPLENKQYKLRIYQFDGSRSFISPRSESSDTSLSITTNAQTQYMRAVLFIENTTVNLSVAESVLPMIEKSSSPTTYAPYYSYELCKIGDYQDKIFKNDPNEDWYDPDLEDNAWYVHKETNKLSANSSQDWSYNGGTSPSNTRFVCVVDDAALEEYTASQPPLVMSNCFGGANWYNIYRGLAGDNAVSLKENAHRIIVHMSSLSTIDAWNTFITNNTVLFRYVIATPTDTQITDATLVGQLNAVHEWLTRYGYSSNVTGNLPIIIDRTNL
jgi:hypothetical protein